MTDLPQTRKVVRESKKGKISFNKICPECKIKYKDCDCDFNCPSCGSQGKYVNRHVLCPNEDCRVMRFFTQ